MMSSDLREVSGRLLTEKQASQIMNVSVALLRKWRRLGGGPGFCKLGSLVRYSETDIAGYIAAQRVEVSALPRHPVVAAEVRAPNQMGEQA
jgi:hypothetical protein